MLVHQEAVRATLKDLQPFSKVWVLHPLFRSLRRDQAGSEECTHREEEGVGNLLDRLLEHL